MTKLKTLIAKAAENNGSFGLRSSLEIKIVTWWLHWQHSQDSLGHQALRYSLIYTDASCTFLSCTF